MSAPGSKFRPSYASRSGEQLILGEWTEEVTALGTGVQVLSGVLGVDAPGDIRDITADIYNFEPTLGHMAKTLLDTAALLPLVGILKYSDEISELGKTATKGNKYLQEGAEYSVRLESKIRMRLADPSLQPSSPLRYKPWAKTSELANVEGVLRDPGSFFLRLDYKMPGALSDRNMRKIRRGESPIVDDDWIARFPEHAKFRGEKIHHHHIPGTEDAIPLPESLHIGKGNKQVWHSFTFEGE